MLGKSDKKVGCLIICGFSSEIHKLNPLNEYLKQQEYVVYCTALARQNVPSSYRTNSDKDYFNRINSVEKDFEKLADICDILIVIGFSLGSLLGFHLAQKYSIDALIVINAPVTNSDYERLLGEWFGNSYKDHQLLMSNKPISFKHRNNLNKVIQHLNGKINSVMCPTLIIQGKMDNIVEWTNAYVLYEKVNAKQKEIQFFPKSSHGICSDCESSLVFIRIHQFIAKIVSDKFVINYL